MTNMNNTLTPQQLHKILNDFESENGKHHFQPCLNEDMPIIHGVKLDCHMMWLIQQNQKDFIKNSMKVPQELQLKFTVLRG